MPLSCIISRRLINHSDFSVHVMRKTRGYCSYIYLIAYISDSRGLIIYSWFTRPGFTGSRQWLQEAAYHPEAHPEATVLNLHVTCWCVVKVMGLALLHRLLQAYK